MVLPLRIFEPRYRVLMQRLLDLPDGSPREFGVIAIRQGWEVGVAGVSALYPVGCTAQLRQIAELDDGTYDVLTVGSERFRLDGVATEGAPYLQASVRRLPENPGPAAEARVLADGVRAVYGSYLAALVGTDQAAALLAELPDDPLRLASSVAASAPLELGDRQALLAADDGVARLRLELRMLKREATMLRRLRAVPIPLAELRVPLGLN
ncbi:MAG: LON peptidase substrate-binding domain-containing protein [Actinomycetota bacterium]|nr:LON peptidase substrate-binding domain-containing protein [Actinomycetota bacterium]